MLCSLSEINSIADPRLATVSSGPVVTLCNKEMRCSAAGWFYTLRRSSRARRLRLQYCRDAGLSVVLPKGATLADAEAFILSQQVWIETCHSRDESGLDQPRRQPDGPDSVELVALNESLILPQGTDALAAQQIVQARARHALPGWVARLSEQTGLQYARVAVRNQRSRWGSYSSKGTVSLNWRLMLLPPDMVDYVVLHELAHSRVMNHSAAFWQLLGSVCPDARGRDQVFDRVAAELIPAWARYWPAS